jgi:hypothetical protein
MRWVVLVVGLMLAILVGMGLWMGVPFYQRVAPFTDVLVDIAERARTENTPDDKIREMVQDAARRHEIEILAESLEVDHPEPGAVHIKLTAIGHPFGKDGVKLNMNLETRRP